MSMGMITACPDFLDGRTDRSSTAVRNVPLRKAIKNLSAPLSDSPGGAVSIGGLTTQVGRSIYVDDDAASPRRYFRRRRSAPLALREGARDGNADSSRYQAPT